MRTMFVRVKTINGKEYAYLVSNTWTRYGSRQAVGAYLGRVMRLPKTDEYPYPPFTTYAQAIRGLIERELKNFGFNNHGQTFTNNEVAVDLDNSTVRSKGKQITLAMHEGFLTDQTIKQALALTPTGQYEHDAKTLASTCLECGITLSDAAFLRLYESFARESAAS